MLKVPPDSVEAVQARLIWVFEVGVAVKFKGAVKVGAAVTDVAEVE